MMMKLRALGLAVVVGCLCDTAFGQNDSALIMGTWQYQGELGPKVPNESPSSCTAILSAFDPPRFLRCDTAFDIGAVLNAGKCWLTEGFDGPVVAELRANAPQSAGFFGTACAADNDRIIVSQWNGGKAFVFDAATGATLATLSSSSRAFGRGAATISCGSASVGTCVEAVKFSDGVVVFRDSVYEQTLTIPGQEWIGGDVAIDGDRLVMGFSEYDAPGGPSRVGAATVWEYLALPSSSPGGTTRTWTQTKRLVASSPTPSEQMGYSVALKGDRVVAGAPFRRGDAGGQPGAAYVFDASLSTLPGSSFNGTIVESTELQELSAWNGALQRYGLDFQGYDVAFAGAPNVILVGAPASDRCAPSGGVVYAWVSFSSSSVTTTATDENWLLAAELTGPVGERHSMGDRLAATSGHLVSNDRVYAYDASTMPRDFDIVVVDAVQNKALCPEEYAIDPDTGVVTLKSVPSYEATLVALPKAIPDMPLKAVVFKFNGTKVERDRVAPYALFEDDGNGDFYGPSAWPVDALADDAFYDVRVEGKDESNRNVLLEKSVTFTLKVDYDVETYRFAHVGLDELGDVVEPFKSYDVPGDFGFSAPVTSPTNLTIVAHFGDIKTRHTVKRVKFRLLAPDGAVTIENWNDIAYGADYFPLGGFDYDVGDNPDPNFRLGLQGGLGKYKLKTWAYPRATIGENTPSSDAQKLIFTLKAAASS